MLAVAFEDCFRQQKVGDLFLYDVEAIHHRDRLRELSLRDCFVAGDPVRRDDLDLRLPLCKADSAGRKTSRRAA